MKSAFGTHPWANLPHPPQECGGSLSRLASLALGSRDVAALGLGVPGGAASGDSPAAHSQPRQ